MNKPRQTVSVAKMLWHANYFMKHSADANVGERRGTQATIDIMLHMTDNYVGFSYLNMKANPNGMSPLIPDESRVFFYVSNGLRKEYNAYDHQKTQEGNPY